MIDPLAGNVDIPLLKGKERYTTFKRKGKKGAATVARSRRTPRKRTKST